MSRQRRAGAGTRELGQRLKPNRSLIILAALGALSVACRNEPSSHQRPSDPVGWRADTWWVGWDGLGGEEPGSGPGSGGRLAGWRPGRGSLGRLASETGRMGQDKAGCLGSEDCAKTSKSE